MNNINVTSRKANKNIKNADTQDGVGKNNKISGFNNKIDGK